MKVKKPIIDGLISSGFSFIGSFKGASLYGIDLLESELIRFFSPTILNLEDGRSLVGLIGSIKECVLRDLGSVDRLSTCLAVTCYSSNFNSLRNPPIWGRNLDDDVSWCDNIASIAKAFPKTFIELKSMLDANISIDSVPIVNMSLYKPS